MPKHHEVTPSRAITIFQEFLCPWVTNYKSVKSLENQEDNPSYNNEPIGKKNEKMNF
jgi:hypothetical protein